ncbi:hypothetical protein BOTBODRAFT_39522 [Botryobasidium botryosum FD-172 SS1]|uniref:F-box domain-containing protein n=1 Tax=Botryobasidium botryosum (strain FD-172 SS1) TaxID=930990 RepID=A0A067M3U7_BOTB1|nr:hypothetical protein BOTBODRAFT_39522 [Botryobasidium botryosum FD-172 SS1]
MSTESTAAQTPPRATGAQDLPDDIILEIYLCCLSLRIPPRVLDQISKQWNAIGRYYLQIWPQIQLDLNCPQSALTALQSFTQDDRPLVDIIIVGRRGSEYENLLPDTPPAHLAVALSHYGHRMRSLAFRGTPHNAITFFGNYRATMNNLSYLKFESFPDRKLPPDIPIFGLLPGSASNISLDLYLRDHTLKLAPDFAEIVTAITLKSGPRFKYAWLRSLLESCPNLQRLEMTTGTHSSAALSPLPNEIDDIADAIDMISLSQLTVSGVLVLTGMPAFNFGDLMTTVTIHRFEWNEPNMHALAKTLSKCPQLKFLTLNGVPEKHRTTSSPISMGDHNIILPHVVSFGVTGPDIAVAILLRNLTLPEVATIRIATVSCQVAADFLRKCPRAHTVMLSLIPSKPDPSSFLTHPGISSLHLLTATPRWLGRCTFSALSRLEFSSTYHSGPPKPGLCILGLLSKTSPPLQSLTLRRVDVTSPEFIQCLAHLPQLEEMELIECRLSDAVFTGIALPSVLPRLSRLFVHYHERPFALSSFLQCVMTRREGSPNLRGRVKFSVDPALTESELLALKSVRAAILSQIANVANTAEPPPP